MVATHTTTIEVKSVVKPIKIISLIFFALSIILALVSISSNRWLTSGSFHTGLFRECTDETEPSHSTPLPSAPMPGKCHGPARDTAFIKAVAGLMISGIILTIFALFFNICGVSISDARRKLVMYRFASWSSILAVIVMLTGLIVFPAVFYTKMKDYGSRRDWVMDWSYGLAWAGTICAFGGAVALISGKDNDEVHYKEKTIYHPPPELA